MPLIAVKWFSRFREIAVELAAMTEHVKIRLAFRSCEGSEYYTLEKRSC